MRIYKSLVVVCALAVLLGLVMAPSNAENDKTPKGETPKVEQKADPADLQAELNVGIPADYQDPAFDRYVDLQLLQNALGSQDASMLADASLQLMHGERALFRSHKKLSADEMLRVTIKLAAEKGDKATMERLAKATQALGKKEFASQIKGLQQFMDKPRKAGPMVGLDQLNTVNIANYQSFLENIRLAKAIGDKESIDVIEDLLKDDQDLTTEQRTHLQSLAKEARATLPETPSAEMEILRELAANSRGDNRSDARASIARGGWTVAYGREVGWREEVALVAAFAVSGGGAGAAYLGDLISSSAKTLGRDIVVKALKNRGQTFGAGTFYCKAGIATYNHWSSHKYPTLRGWATKKISEPNSFQPYVAWRRK